MGAYDTITFECPDCKGIVVAHSYMGPQTSENFPSDSVPVEIADGLVGNPAECGKCNKVFRIITREQFKRNVPLFLGEEMSIGEEMPA